MLNKSTNLIHIINRIKKKNHDDIISKDVEKHHLTKFTTHSWFEKVF